MTSVWFVVPAHGRHEVATVCLRQLRRTCDRLAEHGIAACAVIVADDRHFDRLADTLGFAYVRRDNEQLGRKINDGYQLAFREGGADYAMPVGTDDWVDAEWVAGRLPTDNEVRCARMSSVVSEDGLSIAPLHIDYEGGDGVRMYPRALLEQAEFRPAEEDRNRAIDTSTFRKLRAKGGFRLTYFDLHPWQIVDFKTHGEQLNGYEGCLAHLDGAPQTPWPLLAEHYPAEAITEMRAVYGLRDRVAA